MATPKQSSDTQLEIRRVFAAPREKVFRAWTERQALEQWMCRDETTHDVQYTALDVRVGGRYSMNIRTPAGELHVLEGTYREVRPPEKLVFTWRWKKTPVREGELSDSGETLITVEFLERGGATEVVLRHELPASAGPRESYEKGWSGCFDVLAKVLQASLH